MPAELVKRIDLDLIHPRFLALALDVLAACRDQGAVYFAIFGTRTLEEQDALFAQGRTAPGAIVTNARGGQSAHNFGLAMDPARSRAPDRLDPDWTPAAYQLLGVEAEKRGLAWGGRWTTPDLDHIQLAGWVTAGQLAPLDAIYRATPGDTAARLRAVWAHVDAQAEAGNAGVC